MKQLTSHTKFKNLYVFDHPLIQHKLTLMREKGRSTQEFKQLLKEISMLMGYEMTRDFALTTKTIETPLTTMEAPVLEGKKPVLVPILRAGLGMLDGLLELMPSSRIGHIGLYRDHKTLQPVEYLVKLPDVTDRKFILLDPMLATGNSSIYAAEILIKRGVKIEDIAFMCLLAAPEGVENFLKHYPDIKIYTASLDSHLNDSAYIVPGLGDAGDRLFGTK